MASKPKNQEAQEAEQPKYDISALSLPAPGGQAPQIPSGLPPALQKQIAEAEAKKAEFSKKVKEFLDEIKEKSEDFKKDISKIKEVIGIVLLPPKPQQACGKCESTKVKVDLKKAKCEQCGAEWSTVDMMVLLNIEEAKIDDKYKKKEEIEKRLGELKQKKLADVNISAVMLDEIWDMCFKGKYDILGLIAAGVPIYDTGWLGALRATEIHKQMVLKKFEKYVVCYVLAGSMVKGTAKPESDVDTFIVIDDTDVTRMTASELVAKLRGIIWDMSYQAAEAAGVKNKLNIQIYILTDMWNSIKSAHPVIFTFLRDGIPMFDRGMFTPWKLLLKQGKITPTPEAVESFLKSGKQMLDRTKAALKNIAVDDFFWATLTPSQGVLMLMGLPPGDAKETPAQMREYFVKPGLLEEKFVKTLEDAVKIRKDIEHGKVQEVSAKEIDDLLTRSDAYLKRLDKLATQVENIQVKKELRQLYDEAVEDVQAALKMIDFKVPDDEAIRALEKTLGARKLASARYVDVLKRIQKLKEEGKGDRKEIASLTFEQDRLAKDTFEHIRAEKGKKIEKFKISANYGENRKADIWLLSDSAFIVMDTTDAKTTIKKFGIDKDGALINPETVTLSVVNSALEKFAGTPTKLTRATIDSLKKILAENLQLVVGA